MFLTIVINPQKYNKARLKKRTIAVAESLNTVYDLSALNLNGVLALAAALEPYVTEEERHTAEIWGTHADCGDTMYLEGIGVMVLRTAAGTTHEPKSCIVTAKTVTKNVIYLDGKCRNMRAMPDFVCHEGNKMTYFVGHDGTQ